MNQPDILYPAIFVFSMLLIGLLLTIWEFYRMQEPVKKRSTLKTDSQSGYGKVEAGARKSHSF